MDQRLRPLLPAAENGEAATEPSRKHIQGLVPKRQSTRVACQNCRKRKTKCDGARPACANCSSSTKTSVKCNYALSEAEEAHALSRGMVLKERYDHMKVETQQYHELFDLLRTVPEPQARHMFDQIRIGRDLASILHCAQGTSLPSLNARAALLYNDVHPRLEALDRKALEGSIIQIHSRPWTVVANDGIVSEMITSFFMWDDAFFYPFIDRLAFLDDMRAGVPTQAKYCSPFLVNAICASRCFTSRNAKAYSSILGANLGHLFLDEAEKLLEVENGRPSLPTVQGLALMFALSSHRGMDRAGLMYRYAACEMLKRLNLENTFMHIWPDPSKKRQKQIISKALWGFFCFESIVAFFYLQRSLVKPPKVARFFAIEPLYPGMVADSSDMLGGTYDSGSRSPPSVPNILECTCDLSMYLYDMMEWNVEAAEMIGTAEDIDQRHQIYERLQQWTDNLPGDLQANTNFTPQTCFLSVYLNELFISILRPLPPDTIFDQGRTVKDLCIQYASTDLANMKTYVDKFSLDTYSSMVHCGVYNGLLTLASHLHDPQTHEPFVSACDIMYATVHDFPIARFILQGVKALCWTMKMPVPPAAAHYLENLGTAKEELRDIPLAFALPQADLVRKLLLDKGCDVQHFGSEMGLLLSRWSTLSIE